MEKLNRGILKFVLYFLPIVVLEIILASMGKNFGPSDPKPIYYLFEVLGTTTVLWGALVIYLFFAIAFNEKLKNAFVRKLAGIKENDEREAHITGVVSKKTFISMTGILVLLFFLSAIQVHVYRFSEAEAKNGKHGAIQFGVGLTLVPSKNSEPKIEEVGRQYIIRYEGLPLTSDGTLLLVMILQVGAFYYFSRKENCSVEA